ncbi:MAG: DUF2461 domain-containing protein [Muribaculaceae bacterium]|nr:DUF2461 domain-containing protein [Muribaculaceae bacterium]
MKDLFIFLEQLAANNNRTWFAENKASYDSLRKAWCTDIQKLIDSMSVWDPALRHVDASDCLYRIYRDTRFSPDKTPYKTHFAALISPWGRRTQKAAYYIHAGVDECALYGGVWCPPRPMLAKLRKAIVDNIDEFRSILAAPDMQALYPGWYGSALKTAPKGYDRNHPDIDLLRLNEYGKCHELSREFFTRENWPEEAAELFSTLKPMVDFLNYSIDEEI